MHHYLVCLKQTFILRRVGVYLLDIMENPKKNALPNDTVALLGIGSVALHCSGLYVVVDALRRAPAMRACAAHESAHGLRGSLHFASHMNNLLQSRTSKYDLNGDGMGSTTYIFIFNIHSTCISNAIYFIIPASSPSHMP